MRAGSYVQQPIVQAPMAQTTLIEQAYTPATYATALPSYMERPSYVAPIVAEPIAYSAPALIQEPVSYAVPSVSMSSPGPGKDLKTGGRVVSERPISREELSASGNLAEGMPETRQGMYSTGFSASRAMPVALEQPAFIGSSRQSFSTMPQAIGQVQSSYAVQGVDPFLRSGSLSATMGYGTAAMSARGFPMRSSSLPTQVGYGK